MAFKLTVGNNKCGKYPNVRWKAIDRNELRQHRRFLALPPVDNVIIADSSTFRYVRQDEKLWHSLHDGILSARRLEFMLGFREPMAAMRLGIQALTSDQTIRETFVHLHKPLYCARDTNHTEESAITHNENMKRLHNSTDNKKDIKQLKAHEGELDDFADISDIAEAWGQEQEATVLYGLLEYYKDKHMEETGLCVLRPHQVLKEWNIPFEELPPMGASSDGIFLSQDPQNAQGQSVEREAIEIKNITPFEWEHVVQKYYVKYKEPLKEIPANFMPQIQLQMLIEDTKCNNFVSATVNKGVNIMKVPRDDEYLRKMLHFVREFNMEYVKKMIFPSSNLFWGRKDFQDLLEHTMRLCKGNRVHEHIPYMKRKQTKSNKFYFFDEETD